MPRIWWGNEGNIPAKNKTFEKLRAIKVRTENFPPSRYVERWFRKGNLDTVHVCRVAGEETGTVDPLDVPGLVAYES